MKVKRYWYQNTQTGEESITNAYNLKHLAQKTGIPGNNIRILKIYHRSNLKADDLILTY